MRRFAFTWVLLSIITIPASGEEKPVVKEEKITFEQHILPIFREKCGSCHNANDKKGDLILDNYGLAMQGGASGEVVRTDGDASQSQLYLVVAHMAEPKMPPGQPKLPDDQLALIRKWIEGGSLENAGSKAKPKKNMAVAKVAVSTARPAGPPPMPENLPLDPSILSARGNGVTALAVNPWSSLVSVAGHKEIALYETSTRDLVGLLPFPEGVAHVLKFSRNGQWLLAGGGRGGQSGKVVVWDVKSGKRVTEVGSEYDVVLAADISPDHTQIALGGPKRMVRVYDTSTGELLYEKNKHTDWVTTIEFSPDGVLLATGDRSNGLIVWEAFTGREFYTLPGHTGAITDVSWSPDSNVLASSSEDTTIRLWEMQNGGQIKNWGAHGGGVTAVEFTRDSRIASTGRDNSVKLWDMNGAAIRAFGGLTDVGMDVAFDAELDFILAGDMNGTIHIWNAKDAAVTGQLTTNPAPLAKQLEVTTQTFAAAEATATQSAAALATLTKMMADRKGAADAAAKTAAETASEFDLANKLKTLADNDAVAKTQSFQTAEANFAATQAAYTKAVAERDTINKAVADLKVKLKATIEAITAAEAETSQALAAYEAKPDDANLKAASTAATKKFSDTLTAVSELTKQISANLLEHSAKIDISSAALLAMNSAKTLRDKTAVDKALAEETAAKIAVRHKAAMDLAIAAKTNSDAATAAAVVTPELQTQLANTQAAAKTTADTAARLKARIERLNAAKAQPVQTLEASLK